MYEDVQHQIADQKAARRGDKEKEKVRGLLTAKCLSISSGDFRAVCGQAEAGRRGAGSPGHSGGRQGQEKTRKV